MDALLLTIEMLSLPVLREFVSENGKEIWVMTGLKNPIFMGSLLRADETLAEIDSVREIAHKVVNFVSKIVEQKVGSSKQSSSFENHDLVKEWNDIRHFIHEIINRYYVSSDIHNNLFSIDQIERIENMLLETTDSSNCETLTEMLSQLLLVKKAIPGTDRIPRELGRLPSLICYRCNKQPLALLLIGGLLSFKPMSYNTWNKLDKELFNITNSTSDHVWHIISYCYDDLPYFLKLCFLYFACYPIGYEIPATSLTSIWIAEGFITPGVGEWIVEGFVTPEKEETREETANKYLEQLVQRSLVCVSKRSLLGTIKSFRVPHRIHEFAIQQSHKDEFMVANPDQEKLESVFRLAIHHDNKKQYMEVKNNHLCSFLAFNFNRNIIGSAMLLRVLELRKSTTPVTALPNMIYLRYLGLRGSNISELPENIGDMKNLQTLDVRDTSINTLPKSLWNIKELCHVYVNPNPQTKGPPSTAHIDNLHTLKTVAVHESWVENIPHFLIHLRKLALTNWDNLNWKSISNLLSHMDKLISMAIMGNIIPSEFVDIRAFQNLETVKSIKLQGEWNYRKLPIDNVKFPPNLTKLTLTKSGLKEDPMPTLERLQALKFLSLKDGAYKGKQMVCSANGFPKLQFLELEKLENLENWVVELVMDGSVKKMGIPKLTTLRVVQCLKLNNLPNLDHVTDKVIG